MKYEKDEEGSFPVHMSWWVLAVPELVRLKNAEHEKTDRVARNFICVVKVL